MGIERCDYELLYASTHPSFTSKSKQQVLTLARRWLLFILEQGNQGGTLPSCEKNRQTNKQLQQAINGRFPRLMTTEDDWWCTDEHFRLWVLMALSLSLQSSTNVASPLFSVMVKQTCMQSHTYTEKTVQNLTRRHAHRCLCPVHYNKGSQRGWKEHTEFFLLCISMLIAHCLWYSSHLRECQG